MIGYRMASCLVQHFGIKSIDQYRSFSSSPELGGAFPLYPERVYEEWQGWEKFLGTFMPEEFGEEYRTDLLVYLQENPPETFLKKKPGRAFEI